MGDGAPKDEKKDDTASTSDRKKSLVSEAAVDADDSEKPKDAKNIRKKEEVKKEETKKEETKKDEVAPAKKDDSTMAKKDGAPKDDEVRSASPVNSDMVAPTTRRRGGCGGGHNGPAAAKQRVTYCFHSI